MLILVCLIFGLVENTNRLSSDGSTCLYPFLMDKYGCGNVTIVKLTVVKTPSKFTIQHSLSLWNSIHNHDLNKIIIQQEEPISLQ
jgi:hypothetical protein